MVDRASFGFRPAAEFWCCLAGAEYMFCCLAGVEGAPGVSGAAGCQATWLGSDNGFTRGSCSPPPVSVYIRCTNQEAAWWHKKNKGSERLPSWRSRGHRHHGLRSQNICKKIFFVFGVLGPFLLVRPVSAKTATFWPRSHQSARLTAQRDGN